MAIVKKNTYLQGDNTTVSNLVLNTALPNFDRTAIVFSTPNILIKVGSMVEANGNLYAVESADVSIAAATGNLCFNSNTLTFSISTSSYTYDPLKRGDYVDANTVVCRWAIYSNGQFYRRTPANFLATALKQTTSISWSTSSGSSATISGFSAFLLATVPVIGNKMRVSGGLIEQPAGGAYYRYYNIAYIERINSTTIRCHSAYRLYNVPTATYSNYGYEYYDITASRGGPFSLQDKGLITAKVFV